MRHAEGRRKIGCRKHKDIRSSEEKNLVHPSCQISCTKVKACMLAFIVTWCEACEGRKEGKDEEIKGGYLVIWSSPERVKIGQK